MIAGDLASILATQQQKMENANVLCGYFSSVEFTVSYFGAYLALDSLLQLVFNFDCLFSTFQNTTVSEFLPAIFNSFAKLDASVKPLA